MSKKSAWLKYPQGEAREKLMTFAEGYRQFISKCKTEREVTTEIYAQAIAAGYRDLDELIAAGASLKAGDKVVANNMGKGLVLFVLGREAMEKGMNLLGAHVDSPRIDIKQVPLYEDTELALLDTHYYGGIKKYQWVTLPLAIHGVICRKDGSTVTVNIGEKPTDPVFGITDLLVHLASEQMSKPLAKGIEGENLDVLVGSMPVEDEEEKQAVLANVLRLLQADYGIEEEDLLSAELEVVPAGAARDMGFDRSLIMGYGQDDRSCAYPSWKAIETIEEPERTCVCVLVDKEEIGSVGATGMHSRFFENCVAEVMNLAGDYSELKLRRCLKNSLMISSDVSAGYDPLYGSVMEKKNAALLGHGLVFNKYLGSRGKSGSNDANAEFMAHIRSVMDGAEVAWQTAEIGKVDAGGGGTIAYIMANRGITVIDSGVPVLSMHAPWEVTSKADVYEAFLGYRAFLERA